jgi:hypothetical protein
MFNKSYDSSLIQVLSESSENYIILTYGPIKLYKKGYFRVSDKFSTNTMTFINKINNNEFMKVEKNRVFDKSEYFSITREPIKISDLSKYRFIRYNSLFFHSDNFYGDASSSDDEYI